MSVNNNKGFSLIELMVVVAIIAILATIAVPSYQGFQAKARQKEGFSLMNSYYTAAQATYAEVGYFPGNFVATGFQPRGQVGYRLTALHNAHPPFGSSSSTCVSTGNVAADCDCDQGNCVGATFVTWDEVAGAEVAGANTLGAIAPPSAAAAINNTTFTIVGSGCVSATSAVCDEYTMNERKVMTMVQDGLQ